MTLLQERRQRREIMRREGTTLQPTRNPLLHDTGCVPNLWSPYTSPDNGFCTCSVANPHKYGRGATAQRRRSGAGEVVSGPGMGVANGNFVNPVCKDFGLVRNLTAVRLMPVAVAHI